MRAVEMCFGYDASELQNTHIRALVHPEERPVINHLLGQLITFSLDVTVRCTFLLLHRTARPFPAELSSSLQTIGRHRYVMLSIRDMSEQER